MIISTVNPGKSPPTIMTRLTWWVVAALMQASHAVQLPTRRLVRVNCGCVGCRGRSPAVLLSDKDTRQDGAVSEASLTALRFYKSAISPLLPAACRFIPTCSEYGQQAFERYAPWKATVLTTWRLLRCSPLHLNGYGYGVDEPVWPPPAYWAPVDPTQRRLRTPVDDELSRARARGERLDERFNFGGTDPLGLAAKSSDDHRDDLQ